MTASTSRNRILIAAPLDAAHITEIREAAPDCDITVVDPYPRGATLPVELIADREILFADFAPANIEAMQDLAWIQLGSAGYAQLQGLPLKSMGTRATNASGVNDIPIAEWCLLMMLAFERSLPDLFQVQQQRGWDRAARFQTELRGRRVGILGYGNIGREVARLSQALGLDVWALNRHPVGPTPLKFTPAGTGDPEGAIPSRAFTVDQLPAFLPHLDYLVMTAALNGRTRGLIGEAELRLLPVHAVILNPARAHLIDEKALQRALGDGWIRGAAIDSHYREPLAPDDPAWDVPNVILTPHISGSTLSPRYTDRLTELFRRNLDRFQRGQPLLNEISWEDLSAN
ncbi:MAG TPA: D-2-hydroxyacid dehydrogenase [Thermomicrobiales bacterium]|nr:D-2-hydroxyacid dehydrogenase [Thermomicrobiales bacterium]